MNHNILREPLDQFWIRSNKSKIYNPVRDKIIAFGRKCKLEKRFKTTARVKLSVGSNPNRMRTVYNHKRGWGQ